MKTSKFKMTEIGEIPADWEVKKLGECCINFNYGVGAEAIPYVSGRKYIRITDIDERSRKYKPDVVMASAFETDNSIVNDGDILVARTGASVGKSYCYDSKDGELVFAGFLMRFHPENINSKYVFLTTLIGRYAQWVASESARSGQPGINIQQLKSYQIPVPPLAEQKAIAEALSEVDALIAAQEELIEKKRAIKQGAMQELLTGKKRLVGFKNSESSCLCASVLKKDAGVVEGGFNTETQRRRGIEFKMTEIGLIPENWDVKRIGDMGQVVTGSTPPRKNSANWGGDFNWISAKDFNGKYISKTEEHITEAGKRFCRLLPENSVLVTCIASIGLNAITKKACATNQQINAVVCRVDLPEYLYYQICYRNGDLKLLAGQTAVPIIGKKQFEDVLIPVPSLPEQRAIAEVLSDMDAEIEELEAKRAKYESIKQGMMQELLTGKTRLKG